MVNENNGTHWHPQEMVFLGHGKRFFLPFLLFLLAVPHSKSYPQVWRNQWIRVKFVWFLEFGGADGAVAGQGSKHRFTGEFSVVARRNVKIQTSDLGPQRSPPIRGAITISIPKRNSVDQNRSITARAHNHVV